ncbi:hypothetical protein MYX78_00220 [Acidobacteria bacterium AH-259-G07]|nr:hypothetical protein [Acidobacteria bacterium AH-259-G07]
MAGATRPLTADELVVYLDTSGSMAGYVSLDPQRQTTFSRTLQELRSLFSILDPPVRILVRRVEKTVGRPENDRELSTASVTKEMFRGGETDLAGAIGLFPESLSRELRGQTGEDDSRPPRFHILVTDGVQSTKEERSDSPCIAGSDQICIRKKILELLNSGWGGCIIGIRSEFEGKIYSEVKPGLIIDYSDESDIDRFRPFYLYIFSPDRVALDDLVETLIDRLGQVIQQQDLIRVLPLTSGYRVGFAEAELIIPEEQEEWLELSRLREENPARLTLRVSVDTEDSGPKPFDVSLSIPWSNTAKKIGTLEDLAALVWWDLTILNCEDVEISIEDEKRRYPEITLIGYETDPAGRVVLHASAQWPKDIGVLSWHVYRIEGRLDLKEHTPLWVREWSTNLDISEETGNRTLNLESMLLGLWRNDLLQRQVLAEVCIRVGPL